MSEVFLGVIATAVAVMAIVQVATIVVAMRAARRVGELVSVHVIPRPHTEVERILPKGA